MRCPSPSLGAPGPASLTGQPPRKRADRSARSRSTAPACLARGAAILRRAACPPGRRCLRPVPLPGRKLGSAPWVPQSPGGAERGRAGRWMRGWVPAGHGAKRRQGSGGGREETREGREGDILVLGSWGVAVRGWSGRSEEKEEEREKGEGGGWRRSRSRGGSG